MGEKCGLGVHEFLEQPIWPSEEHYAPVSP